MKDKIRAMLNMDGKLVTERDVGSNILNNQFQPFFVKEPGEELPMLEHRKVDFGFGVEDLLDCISTHAIARRLDLEQSVWC